MTKSKKPTGGAVRIYEWIIPRADGNHKIMWRWHVKTRTDVYLSHAILADGRDAFASRLDAVKGAKMVAKIMADWAAEEAKAPKAKRK